MSVESTFKKINKTITLFNNRFLEGVTTRQNGMWRLILGTIKKLETDAAGNILSNTANLKLLRTLRGDIKNIVLTKTYKAEVATYLKSFSELKAINDTYYQAIASGTYTANKFVYNEVLNYTAEATANSLLDAGIMENVVKPIETVLTQNITTGGTFTDLTEVLQREVLGDPQTAGKLSRYTKQITTDALNQFNANYNQTVSQDLSLEFYYYSGAVKETTRPYCRERAGNYYHKREVEESAAEQWPGKIPGTNASNILTYRGGYNCGHQWLAVDALAVPKSVRERAINKGYYEES